MSQKFVLFNSKRTIIDFYLYDILSQKLVYNNCGPFQMSIKITADEKYFNNYGISKRLSKPILSDFNKKIMLKYLKNNKRIE